MPRFGMIQCQQDNRINVYFDGICLSKQVSLSYYCDIFTGDCDVRTPGNDRNYKIIFKYLGYIETSWFNLHQCQVF